MISFLLRRFAWMAVILLVASFIVYNLAAYSGDPLQDLRTDPNAENLIKERTEKLDLNTPPPLRFFRWLPGAVVWAFSFGHAGTLGDNISGRPVSDQLGTAVVQTLSLVGGAVILAIIIGVSLGVLSALRQYTIFDYSVTFVAFLFFALPIFWVAVLLKEYGAIGFNNFLQDPHIAWWVITLIAIVVGALALLIFWPKTGKNRVITFGVGFGATFLVLVYISATGWFEKPGLGIPGILLTGLGAAFAVTALISGLKDRKVLYSALTMVGIGVLLYFPIQPLFNVDIKLGKLSISQGWLIFFLGVVTIGVGWIVGRVWAGKTESRLPKISAIITGITIGLVIILDRFMQSWPQYSQLRRGRPIATVGTPSDQGNFWLSGVDHFSHFILPTIALILISIATYTRYSRASMLEVLNMDYIRTEKAKGAPRRMIVINHALRNALIPIVTIIAIDLGAIFSGAIITESVFEINGMGKMFITGLKSADLNVVMAFFIVTASATLVFNLIADLLYSALDPRVRVRS